jgi:hypothetical protein
MRALVGDSSTNVSRLIAVALFNLETVEEDMIQSILNFNVDQEKLELEIRMQLIAIILDGKTNKLEQIKQVFDLLAKTFGVKFCFKFSGLIKENNSF